MGFSKVAFFLVLGLAVTMAVDFSVPEGVVKLSDDYIWVAKYLLEDYFALLANGGGSNYKVGKINWATFKRYPFNIQYTYELELTYNNETKTCHVVRWCRNSLDVDTTEVIFYCPGEGKVVKSSSEELQ